jgi:uncharacterized Tic20 family protein
MTDPSENTPSPPSSVPPPSVPPPSVPPPPPEAAPSSPSPASATPETNEPSGTPPGLGERLPFGTGALSAADDRLYSTLSQLVPVIIWLWKKDESPAVNLAGKEALNFHITSGLLLLVMSLVNAIPVLGWCVFAPMFALLWLGVVVLCVIGALKSSDGYFYKYPLNLRLVS